MQVNDAVPFDVVGCEKVEEHMKGIVGVFEHAGRYFVGETIPVALAVDVKVRDADRHAVGVSVRGGKIQSRENHGVGGAAQLALEFEHNALLRDVKREGFACNGGSDQGDGDRLQDGGCEVEGGFGRFDFAGAEVGVGAGLSENWHSRLRAKMIVTKS